MKKLLAIILAALMVMSFAACSDGNTSSGGGSSTDSGSSTQTAGIAKDQIKVGVIHIGNPSDGAGYSYAHDQGIVAMQKDLGLSDSQIVRKNNISDGDAAATKTAIEECIEAGCNIIFGTSWGYMDTMADLAGQYPDVYFSHGTGYKSNDKTSTTILAASIRRVTSPALRRDLKPRRIKSVMSARWATPTPRLPAAATRLRWALNP